MTICNNYFLDFISLLSDDFSNSLLFSFVQGFLFHIFFHLSVRFDCISCHLHDFWSISLLRNRMRNVPEYSNHWAGFWKTEKSHRCDIITNKYPNRPASCNATLGSEPTGQEVGWSYLEVEPTPCPEQSQSKYNILAIDMFTKALEVQESMPFLVIKS